MNVLGIESTAHTLGIGICTDGTKLIHHSRTYVPPVGEGFHPRKVAEHHERVFRELLDEVFSAADMSKDAIDAVALSQGPGLWPCLKVGLSAAKSFAVKYDVPLIGVNHCMAHIEIGKYCTGFHDPLVIYVSGGNTQLIVQETTSEGLLSYRVIGETLDLGLGNMIDQFARLIGGLSHGGVVESLAREGTTYIPLPYTVKGMSFSFSGVLTAIERLWSTHTYRKEDLAFSLQETVFAAITEATERALCLTNKKEVLGVGGVMQNKRFAQMLSVMTGEHGGRYGTPPDEYNRDNGGMIAYTGWLLFSKGHHDEVEGFDVKPKWRTDEVVWKQ